MTIIGTKRWPDIYQHIQQTPRPKPNSFSSKWMAIKICCCISGFFLSFSNFIFIISNATDNGPLLNFMYACISLMTNGFRGKKRKIFSKNNSGFDGNLFIKLSKIMESRAFIRSAVRLHLFEYCFLFLSSLFRRLCNKLCVQRFLCSWYICSHYLPNTFHQKTIEKELIGNIFISLLCFAWPSIFLLHTSKHRIHYSRTSSRFWESVSSIDRYRENGFLFSHQFLFRFRCLCILK